MLFVFLLASFSLRVLSASSTSDTVTYAVIQATVSVVPTSYSSADIPSDGVAGHRRKPYDRRTESLADDEGVYAAFGSTSSYSGPLVKAVPFNACRRLHSWFYYRRAVLVEYGGCNYTHKVKNVKLAGAHSMILKNKDERLMQMESDRDWPRFIAVMVEKSYGLTLEKRLDEGNYVNVTIRVGKTQRQETYGLINEKAFTVICVAFGFVIVLSMFGLSFFYIQRCRVVGAERRRQKRLKRKAEKAVNRLPTRVCKGRSTRGSRVSTYNDSSSTSSGTETCVICLDDFCRGDLLRTLPCNHEFHKVCIDPWLLDKRTCPMCKLDILKILTVRNTAMTETNSSQVETRFSSPVQASLSRAIVHESEPVDLRSVRFASASHIAECGVESCEGVGNETLPEIVAAAVHVTEMLDAGDEHVPDTDVAPAVVVDIDPEPSNESKDSLSKSGSQCETNKLASASAHSLTSQTSGYRSELRYDSRDCLI